jgi:hypothetical protein
MDIDPMEYVETEDDPASEAGKEKSRSRLNSWVAITVALVAAFMAVCKVKDDNIVQAMQQAQAKSIDDWSWYQSRNIRQDLAEQGAVQLDVQAQAAAPALRPIFLKQATAAHAKAKHEGEKKDEQKKAAEADQKAYDDLNFHDDQFDLSDALLSLAIALLAVTALTQKRWLYGIALVPTVFGILMGLAGLLGWNLHPDLLIKPLGT